MVYEVLGEIILYISKNGYGKTLTIVLITLIVVAQPFVMLSFFAKAETTANATPSVRNGAYLRYTEEVKITWTARGWNQKTLGDMTRKISIVSIEDENFTVKEKISYTTDLPSDLPAFYYDVEYMDGQVTELASGTGSSLGIFTGSESIQYVVRKSDGKILQVWKDDPSDALSEVPKELQFWWGYYDSPSNSWEYAWDVVGFTEKDDIWAYSVTPNLAIGSTFDQYTVDSVSASFTIYGDTHSCMSLSKTWSDGDLADWQGTRLCDLDTGIEVQMTSSGTCQLTVYNQGTLQWSLKSGFTLTAVQALESTNFKLRVPDKIQIINPIQGQMFDAKQKIKILYEVDAMPGTENPIIIVSATWMNPPAGTTEYEKITQFTSGGGASFSSEWEPNNPKGKWRIKITAYADVLLSSVLAYDSVDVFFKPISIGDITIAGHDQVSQGPFTDHPNLNRVPMKVSFDINVKEQPASEISLLIDCWYLPLGSAVYAGYIKGSAAELVLFREKYGEKVTNDPIQGKITGSSDARQYAASGYQYDTGTINSNSLTEITVNAGDTLEISNNLFFANPAASEFRLYSFDVILSYEVDLDGETVTITDHAQETIAVKHVAPISKYSGFQAFMISSFAGWFSQNPDFATQVYEATINNGIEVGASLLLAYSASVAIDTTIILAGTGVMVYAAVTTPVALIALQLISGEFLPSSKMDIVAKVFEMTYGSISPEERVQTWFDLITGFMGSSESKLIDASHYLGWAGIVEAEDTGTLAEVNLELWVSTYKDQTTGKYHIDWSIRSPATNAYNARYFGVAIETESGWTWYIPSSTKTYLIPVGTVPVLGDVYGYVSGKYLLIQPNEAWQYKQQDAQGNYVDRIIGSTDNAAFKIHIYFGPGLWRGAGALPVYTFDLQMSEGYAETLQFTLPAIRSGVSVASPCDLHVYDQYGRHVGRNAVGGIDLEIPGVWYSGPDVYPEFVLTSDPALAYTYQLIGTDDDHCNLWFYTPILVNDTAGMSYETLLPVGLTNVAKSEGEEQVYLYDFDELAEAVNVLTAQGWSVSDAVYYVTSNLDSDGDGVPDGIDATPQPEAAISVALSTTEIPPGSTVTVTGSMPTRMPGATLNLTYTRPDGSTVNRTVTTSADGSYSDNYSPDTHGSWTVEVSWIGIMTSIPQPFTVKQSGCFIATATYGSALSPEVQFLRGFRDNQIGATFAGSQFINVFNTVYYAFSPAVASMISSNDALRTVVKGVLRPMMMVLHVGVDVYTMFSVRPDVGVIMFCLVVSFLLSLIYLAPWALLITYRRHPTISSRTTWLIALTWTGGLLALLLAEVTRSPVMMMASGTIVVIVTAGLTILTVLQGITRYVNHGTS